MGRQVSQVVVGRAGRCRGVSVVDDRRDPYAGGTIVPMWTGANTTRFTNRYSSTTASAVAGSRPAFQEFLRMLSSKVINGPSPAWNRIVQGELGRDTGWLLPAALATGIGGLFTRRRSYYILWTGWLVSMVRGLFGRVHLPRLLHGWLSPPIAAILGGGIASLWESRTEVRAVANRRVRSSRPGRRRPVGCGIWWPDHRGRMRGLAGTPGRIARCRGWPAPGGFGRRLAPPKAAGSGAHRRHGRHPCDAGIGYCPTRRQTTGIRRYSVLSRRRRQRPTPSCSDRHRKDWGRSFQL